MQVIARKKDVDWRTVQKLIDVQKRLGKSLEELAAIVMADLHEEPYTHEEVRACGNQHDVDRRSVAD